MPVKLSKRPFLFLTTGESSIRKSTSACRREREKAPWWGQAMIPMQSSAAREHSIAVLEDLWVGIACYLKDLIKLNFGAQQLYMISCLYSKNALKCTNVETYM